MILYRSFLVIDILALIVTFYFFIIGIADGSVSNFNLGLWLFLIIAQVLILVGGYFLHQNNKFLIAKLLLAVTAIPSLIYLLFILLILITTPKWN